MDSAVAQQDVPETEIPLRTSARILFRSDFGNRSLKSIVVAQWQHPYKTGR